MTEHFFVYLVLFGSLSTLSSVSICIVFSLEISYIMNLLLNLTKIKILQKLHILGLDYVSTSKDWLNGENTEPTLTSEEISGALLTDKSRDPRRKSTEDESPRQNIK